MKLHCANQGWTPRPARRGGFPAPPRTAGKGGFPAPPRPVKMIKTAGKLRGKIKARISIFSNIKQYYNTEQCPIQPVNGICKRK